MVMIVQLFYTSKPSAKHGRWEPLVTAPMIRVTGLLMYIQVTHNTFAFFSCLILSRYIFQTINFEPILTKRLHLQPYRLVGLYMAIRPDRLMCTAHVLAFLARPSKVQSDGCCASTDSIP